MFLFLTVLLHFSFHPICTIDTIKTIDTLEYVMGNFEPRTHPLFKLIPTKYSSKPDQYLRDETLNAFIHMSEAAAKDGIKLIIISATRNFYAQKSIWENKWTGKTLVEDGQNLAVTTTDPIMRSMKILKYSSMPSTSRHHWGTDMDLNSLSNDYFNAGEGKKIYDWLCNHGPEYGFCQPYTAGRPFGYNEEKWHWSYLPISKALTDFCQNKMSNNKIKGFLGSETAMQIDVVRKYILGINPSCL